MTLFEVRLHVCKLNYIDLALFVGMVNSKNLYKLLEVVMKIVTL